MLFGIILFITATPALGFQLGIWDKDVMWPLYWTELTIIGAVILFNYAKHLLVFSVLLGLVFAFFSAIDLPFWSDLRAPLTFWTLYSLCWLCYFEINKGSAGWWIKSLSPLLHFTFYIAYMTASIALCFVITAAAFNAWAIIEHMPLKVMMIFIAAAALIPTLMIGLLRVIDMIGPKHFLHFLIGTYHRPIKQEKIVLFLDMVGSTTIAEKMTPEKSMALIAQFIFDAGLAFRRNGGDIINYTGDGLTVLWPTSQADRAIKAVEGLAALLRKKEPRYKDKFKHVPTFRIGIHAGDVIISQIGEEKLFLGLYGDVVNTAARLEAMSKELETQVVFSKAVQQRLGPIMKERAIALGLKNIKGRKDRVEVFTLDTETAGKPNS